MSSLKLILVSFVALFLNLLGAYVQFFLIDSPFHLSLFVLNCVVSLYLFLFIIVELYYYIRYKI